MKVISEELRRGMCACCKERVGRMVFVQVEGRYEFWCPWCVGKSPVPEYEKEFQVVPLDKERMKREEYTAILLKIAREDECIFRDPRLRVIQWFEEEVIDGEMTERLQSYLRFNGNDSGLVRSLRLYAMAAQDQLDSGKKDPVYAELVGLYVSARVRLLEGEELERVEVLKRLRKVQELDEEYRQVWRRLKRLKELAECPGNEKRFDALEEVQDVLREKEEKGYFTEEGIDRLRVFMQEVDRRSRNK